MSGSATLWWRDILKVDGVAVTVSIEDIYANTVQQKKKWTYTEH
jgi:hypothetical protein